MGLALIVLVLAWIWHPLYRFGFRFPLINHTTLFFVNGKDNFLTRLKIDNNKKKRLINSGCVPSIALHLLPMTTLL